MQILELNENQGLNPKRPKHLNPQSMEVATKLLGVFRLPSFREGLLIVFCFVILIILLQMNLFPRTLEMKVGQASKTDVITPRDIVDREATLVAQKEAVKRALDIAKQDLEYYSVDESVGQMGAFNLNRFFELMDSARKRYDTSGTITPVDLQVSKYKSFFYIPPKPALLQQIIRLGNEDYQQLKVNAHQILVELETKQRIDAKGLPQVKTDIPLMVNKRNVSPKLASALTGLLEVSIQPNLVLNAVRINRLENRIRMEVPEIVYHQGELLISKNQVITENDMKMLEELHLTVDKTNQVKVSLSLAIFILILIGVGWVYINQFHSELFKQERLLYLLLLILLLTIGMIKVLSLVDNSAIPYLAPVSFAAMLITILIDSQVALAMSVVLSLLGGIIVEYNLALTIFYYISGVVAVLTLTGFHRQRDLVRSGSLLMFSNAVLVTVLNLLFQTSFNYAAVLLATAGGFLSAVLAIGSLPFLENIFKITSPIRLLELSNPGHPLLRRLQIEAPGTYQHSIMVGNLAESAAEGIGADALWARVGSLYHDIGKIRRPYFFVENQFSQENPHEKLNPTLSTLIITYHVKEGVEIAREHGLPDKLIDIIEQHHGTDLVRYFYKRAADNAQTELPEEDFRYEGPKPQSKEAALVMMADSVEAAVKSLPKPTPSKVEALVQKIIRERLDDGQFDECNLTLKDLTKIKNSFLKVLGGLFHTRIEYPETVLKEIEKKNGDIPK